ncbi:MAG: DUF4124 domain-containing protein [Marinobacter sp.]|uniref:DUF4124 domain-containing protein n=1 Tax=Marinobacter sp. TaxID=50741 RepID=UPI00299E1E25|nr:DUF4124 domain-containing protein [Marinobacter sp.]MDX1635312.1 DUF4124 domain-containing protein [Marinobacter sp.]
MNRPVRSVLSYGLCALLLAAASAEARMYRYTDDNGQLVISNTVPSDATSRGYEILNDQGRVIQTIAPAPTEEELAARAAAEEREAQEARQREADAKLLRRFSHPDDAVRAMHRKLQEMQSLNQLKRGNISVIVNQLDEEQARAADLERSGREIPDATLQKIERLQAQIREIEREIVVQNSEIETMRKRFVQDIERLEEITGERRSLPLDPETAASEQ